MASKKKRRAPTKSAHSRDEFPGTGIGLAMVKRIVELMDGEVGVVSSAGQGSCFWIELPAAPQTGD